jgi:NAD(P)H-dependent FMN reductase
MRILAISGSLRAASSNSAILRIAAEEAPEGIEIVQYDGIGGLPFFNPDLDGALDDPALPAPVRELRAAIAASDVLLISSPEYAHGISGVMKNALDWLVGGAEMVDKRVVLFNTAPHATYAHAAIQETLRTMSTRLDVGAALSIAMRGTDESTVRAAVRRALATLLPAR